MWWGILCSSHVDITMIALVASFHRAVMVKMAGFCVSARAEDLVLRCSWHCFL